MVFMILKYKESVSMRNFDLISDLISYLGTVTKPLAVTNISNSSSEKINRFQHLEKSEQFKSNLSCFKCGRIGHQKRHCPLRNVSQHFKRDKPLKNNSFFKSVNQTQNETITKNNSLKSNKCNFCLKSGHTIDSCFVKNSIDKRRNVNFIL